MAKMLNGGSNGKDRIRKHKVFKNRLGEEFEEGDAMADMANKFGGVTGRMLPQVIGVSLGCTINMGNYESQRIDVWTSDEVRPDETREEAIYRVAEELQRTITTMQEGLGGN